MKIDERDRTTGYNTGLAKVAFRPSQTHLWLIEVWFSALTFVVKIATFVNPKTVISNAGVSANLKLAARN